jgi:hypothetical protein
MTVTYRRAADERGGPGGGGSGGFVGGWRPGRAGGGPSAGLDSATCRSCDTRYDVRIEPREAVVIRVSGRTCRQCNPHWRPPPEAASGRRRVAIVPTGPSDGALRIETLSENVADKSAIYLPERIVSARHRLEWSEVTEQINVAWRKAVAPILSGVLAEADRHAVAQAWRPEHCEALEAIAEALDDVWATAVSMADETTVAIRVVGLPAVTAALIVDVVDRATVTAREPITLTGELLRFTGVAICADTLNAVTCGRLRRELEAVPEVPDAAVMLRLETRFARALTASPSEITIHEFLNGPAAQPERVGVEPEYESLPEAPRGPIGASIAATAPAVDAPTQTAIFGE